MKSQLNILLGGLGLFALQGCKTPQAEQAQQPNVIYVFSRPVPQSGNGVLGSGRFSGESEFPE